jgi:hypothetical protein
MRNYNYNWVTQAQQGQEPIQALIEMKGKERVVVICTESGCPLQRGQEDWGQLF